MYIDHCRHYASVWSWTHWWCFTATPTVIISEDFVNAAHVDEQDVGHSCSLWFEKHPGTAQNWFFIFPHVIVYKDEVKYCGPAIQLFHGCLISWEGSKLRQNSSIVKPGDDNHAHSIFFALKKSSKSMIDDDYSHFLVGKKDDVGDN